MKQRKRQISVLISKAAKLRLNPGELNLPKIKIKWKELSSYQRYYYKNREKEKQRTKQRTQMLKKWFKQYKRNFKCEKNVERLTLLV